MNVFHRSNRPALFALASMLSVLAGGCFNPPEVTGTTDETGDDVLTGEEVATGGAADTDGPPNPSATSSDDPGDDDELPADDGTTGGGTQGFVDTGDASDTDPQADDGTGDADGAEESSTGEAQMCGLTETCSAEAPGGWSGPALVYMGAGDAPACPEEAPNLVVDGGSGLDAPPAECECSCGDAFGFECTVDVTERGNSCQDLVFNPDTFTIGFNECLAVDTADNAFSAGSPQLDLSDAECTPSFSETIPTADFATRVAVCEPDDDTACSEGTCLPDGGEDFGATCIYTGGEAECPAGPYQEQTIVHSSFTDTRQCSTCECGDPTGTCDGTVTYRGGCGFIFANYGTTTPPGCFEATADPTAIRFNGESDLSCQESGGDPMGSVNPLGTVTVCCMAD
ncbi:MAG: hypothetical protein AAF721_36075 [Myxococcota bacterium]